MAIVQGEIDWNSGDANTGGGKGGVEFMRLKQGTATVRVMGNPFQFYTNWVDLPNGSKKKYYSPIGDPELLEMLEEADFKRKPRWMLKVLDRSDETFKVLEIGPQIYNGIKALFNNEKWGKVTKYDIDIIRAKPGTNPLYSVQPNPKEDLDAKFKQPFMEFNASVNLEAITKPSDPEEIRRDLGWASAGATQDDSSDEDYEFDFE